MTCIFTHTGGRRVLYQDALGTIDRRYEIYAYIKVAKTTSYAELMRMFNISRTTVRRDLDFVEKHLLLPIIRTPGNGGGISLDVTKKIEPTYFTLEEVLIIMTVISSLDGERRSQMESILVRHMDIRQLPEECERAFHYFCC